MMTRHLVFIVNPNSGVERKKRIRIAIENYLDVDKYSYEIVNTRYARHGIDLARQAAKDKAYAVIAVGGDGSVNDIISGLLGTNTILGIIPKGSGNGMARTLNISLADKEAIDVINNGNIANMDVAFANEQLFISNAGVAFDALISKKFAKSTNRGLMIYSWLVTKHLWTYKEWKWKITIDGKELETEAFIVNIANGKQFGYNFKIAPDADYTDGLLDVIVIHKFPKILGGALALRALNGTITNSDYVEHFRGKEIIVSHPGLKLMQTDGDAHPCGNTVKFRIEHGAQKIFVP
ncbi:MAG TPA: diacylglycerol kinase family protein [Flavipsychrobacter sp.]|nr:diacylglycerol kinase family protein [Flavipsychrobacter sp.]